MMGSTDVVFLQVVVLYNEPDEDAEGDLFSVNYQILCFFVKYFICFS